MSLIRYFLEYQNQIELALEHLEDFYSKSTFENFFLINNIKIWCFNCNTLQQYF